MEEFESMPGRACRYPCNCLYLRDGFAYPRAGAATDYGFLDVPEAQGKRNSVDVQVTAVYRQDCLQRDRLGNTAQRGKHYPQGNRPARRQD